jgi:hypothetical protein
MGLFDDILSSSGGEAQPVPAPTQQSQPAPPSAPRQTDFGPRPALAVTPHAKANLFADIVGPQGANVEAPGVVDTLGRSVANAATFGLADRGAALGEALTGIGGEFGEYSKNLAKEQELTKAANEQHPIAATLGTLGGAVVNPIGAEVAAPTIAGRIGQGIATGAAQGAAYGAGSSPDLTNLPEVAKNTAEGALTGGGIGGAAVPLVEVAAPIAKFVANATGIPQVVKSLFDPEGAATKLIGEALERDKANRAKIIARRAALGETPAESEINRLGLTPQEHGTAADNGLPVNIADLGGEATRRLARTAANISPEARDILQSETAARFEGQQSRIADRLTQLGGGNSSQTLDKLKERAAAANRPKYQKAYEEGAKGVWTPELERLSAAPAVQDAIKGATKTGRNYDVAHGFKPTKNPFQESESGVMQLRAGENGETPIPALQFWDHVKRNLDDKIDVAKRAGEKNEAATLTELKKKIVAELDEAVPSYADARSTAAKFFGAGDALEAGEKFVTAKGENHDFAKAIKSFNPAERELFAHGFMSKMEDLLKEKGANRNAVIDAAFNSPAAKQRIEMAIGPNRARQLEAHLHVEAVMDQLRNAVTGNSTTAQQLKDIVTHGGALGSAFHLVGILRAFIQHGAKGLDERVMQHVAEGLTSRDPSVYERAVRTVQASSQLAKAFKTGVSDLLMKEILAERARQSHSQGQRNH